MTNTAPTGNRVPTAPAIISPVVDFLCCGGLSIVVVLTLFAWMLIDPESTWLPRSVELVDILLLSFLINFPHFMASYRILYRRRDQVTQHYWASTYVPLILVLLIVYAFLTPSQSAENPEFANGLIIEGVTLAAAMLLAWHYTGQAWGMTASFAFIGGLRMEKAERLTIRSGMYALLILHVLWAALMAIGEPERFVLFHSIFDPHWQILEALYFGWWAVVALTIPLGIWGFMRLSTRTGHAIPKRALVPWVAIYLWYLLVSFRPGLFGLLQIFHALQYLIFPIRVEMNQYAAKRANAAGNTHKETATETVTSSSKLRIAVHGLAYYVVLVVIGFLVFASPQYAKLINQQAFYAVHALTVGFVNIHHYFIDGAIWKIRNPGVRRVLFAHLQS